MHLTVLTGIHEIGAAAWNALDRTANPFLRHEFLHALEASGCVAPRTGWQPCHLVVHGDRPGRGPLLGAAPLYIKSHSFGEHVFDWAWAGAYERAGLSYYPKLIGAVPFSPITGPRLLVAPQADRATVASAIIAGALELARNSGLSSVHWLFPHDDEPALLERHGLMRRVNYQYHWHHRGYRDFEDLLSTFTAEKRKKVRRERRHVNEAGVATEVVTGEAITEAHCDAMHEFHCRTLQAYGSPLFLSRGFYRMLGRTMPESVVLIFAHQSGRLVGGALNLRNDKALFGRYWGGERDIHSLHFEVCYYRAIEYCIEQGLARFEGGAGGEHKLARGFEPVATCSAHWLAHPQFANAVADFLARERAGLEFEIDELADHTPYRKAAG